MIKIIALLIIYFLGTIIAFPQNNKTQKILLIRCDDIGMNHSVNQALEELIKLKIPISASIMFTCPWYQEGVEIIKKNPQITAGIHLVLNAEWKNYRWGPVLGKEAVPSLVDSVGYFFPSRAAFYANNPRLDEIEKELRAQVERAVHSGLNIKYIDYHMGTAVDKPEYRKIVESLAEEFHLGISRYFGEEDLNSMYSKPIEHKADSLYNTLDSLEAGKVNLLVCHIGKDNPEMQALVDLNSFGLKDMSKHRQAELNALLNPKFLKVINQNNIKLINYADIISEIGLDKMKRSEEIGY